MELSEKERLMIVGKMEEISKLTTEILDIENNPEEMMEIKKKMTTVLSLLRTINSYSRSKNMNLLYSFMFWTNTLFFEMIRLKESNAWFAAIPWIEFFCNFVNSIQFDLTKRDIKIKFPKIEFPIFKHEG